MSDMDTSFASRFRDARIAKGITQDRIAKLLGISREAVGQWERGQTVPSFRNLKIIQDLLGLEETGDSRPVEKFGEHASNPSGEDKIFKAKVQSDHDLPVKMHVVGKYGKCIPASSVQETGDDFIFRPAYLQKDPDAYAVVIASMIMAPRFEMNETIYISTVTFPVEGEYVIVRCKADTPTEGTRLYHLLNSSSEHIVLEQYQPKNVFAVQRENIIEIHRVVPWSYLIEKNTNRMGLVRVSRKKHQSTTL